MIISLVNSVVQLPELDGKPPPPQPFYCPFSETTRVIEPVPEENFWILWCKGRLTEADGKLADNFVHFSVNVQNKRVRGTFGENQFDVFSTYM